MMFINEKPRMQEESEAKAMFDMSKVGRKFSQLRKQKNMTQMELADKLNISFQAVSNWERGQTMPDISKFPELSDIFEVSIDEILESDRGAVLIKSINEDEKLEEPITKEELVEIAPLLRTKQVEKAFEDIKENVDISEISSFAPFLSQAFIDEIAIKAIRQHESLNNIAPIAPFVSSSLIDEMAADVLENKKDLGEISAIAPFINPSLLDNYAKKIFEESGNISNFSAIAPFLSQEFIDECAIKTLETYDLSALTGIAPFISDDLLNRLAKEALDKHGLSALSPIMPFIDSRIVENYIKENVRA